MELPVLRLDDELPLPTRARSDDAGLDLRAAEDVTLEPNGHRAAVPTGLAVEIPAGWAGLVLPRSGLASEHGVTLANSPGLIDAGYRGEVRVVLINTDPTEVFKVARGDRIAQLVLISVPDVRLVEVESLSDSERGAGGFGHSGR